MPAELAVSADFGLTVLHPHSGSHDAAYRFALFLLTPEAQQTLVDYGFSW
ncbi:substrate-binding domain-containing protein [Collimonas humicola]